MSEDAADVPERKRRSDAWEPTEEQLLTIERLASRGMRKRDIAYFIGRGKTTIEANDAAQEAYESGHAKILGMLATSAYQVALGLDANGKQTKKIDGDLLKYLCKAQLGWSETNKHEHTGANGGPIEHIDLSRLTDEQLEAYGRISAIAAGLDPDAIIITEQPST